MQKSMPFNSVGADTMTEHDLFMDELLRRLKATNQNGKTQDPFITTQTPFERYPMYAESTH